VVCHSCRGRLGHVAAGKARDVAGKARKGCGEGAGMARLRRHSTTCFYLHTHTHQWDRGEGAMLKCSKVGGEGSTLRILEEEFAGKARLGRRSLWVRDLQDGPGLPQWSAIVVGEGSAMWLRGRLGKVAGKARLGIGKLSIGSNLAFFFLLHAKPGLVAPGCLLSQGQPTCPILLAPWIFVSVGPHTSTCKICFTCQTLPGSCPVPWASNIFPKPVPSASAHKESESYSRRLPELASGLPLSYFSR
jgi:hypothetical protein